jgi:transcriptional regulator with PAS, ATPase and Fis domain
VRLGRGDARAATRTQEDGVVTLDVRVPGRSMSSTHARLVRVGPSWALDDLGSKNGLFVNGVRVERAILGEDDVFELGHTFFRVRTVEGVPPDAPLDLDLAPADHEGHPTLDPALAAQLDSLARLASGSVPVLVLGDSGTGKEILARWVHGLTGRQGAFIAVNCGAIQETLLESQMFGHVKGAFSGAVRDEPGFVRAASGGTLFLDEIADLPKPSQAALLRVLQEREVVPVGATRAVKVDVRLVAATHQSLERLVASGAFRRDLFARLAGFTITLPSLRARRDDLGILVGALLKKVAPESASIASVALSPEAGLALLRYDWPYNVRELEQCLAVGAGLARDGVIERAHLPPQVSAVLDEKRVPAAGDALGERDARLLADLLEQLTRHQGNVSDVARAMGKARMQIHRWCRRFGLDPMAFRR